MMIVLLINKKTKEIKEIRNLKCIKRITYSLIVIEYINSDYLIEIKYINSEIMKKEKIIVNTNDYNVIIKEKW